MERTYVIPLRREWIKVQNYMRAKKAVTAVKEFIQKHMKTDDARLGKHLNLLIWKNGMQNPPAKVKVLCIRDDKNTVTVELVGKKYDEKNKGANDETKKEDKKVEAPKAEAKTEVKSAEAKPKEEAPKKKTTKKATAPAQ